MSAFLTRAGPAEVLRAYQKDEFFCKEVKDMISEIALRVGGTGLFLKYREMLNFTGSMLYYGMTTLSGLQTPGEEYTGILQFDAAQSNIPTAQKRLLMILLTESGHRLITTMLTKIKMSSYLQSEDSIIRREARYQLIKILAFLNVLAPFALQLHRVAFYWTGSFYEFSKRITGIQYILVRYWLKNRDSLYGFKLLSIVTLLQTVIVTATSSVNYWKFTADEEIANLQDTRESEVVPSDKRCPMCLDERKSTSLTPCGHLFCWYCIQEWVQKEQKCPVCRERVMPSRIILLRNYS